MVSFMHGSETGCFVVFLLQLQYGWMVSAVFVLFVGFTGLAGYLVKLMGPLTLSAAIILHGFNHTRTFPSV